MPENQSERMNRFLRTVFFALAILSAAYAGLFVNFLHKNGQSVAHAKMVWLTAAASIFLLVAAWKFSVKVKFKIFAVFLSLLFVEIVLQAAAWLGVLPAVDTKLKAPFARIYWTAEGRGNDFRNRLGWHFPEFDLKASRRIAVIGDSFVEAVEVGRNQNEAADLQKLLKQKSLDYSVLALGTHGTSPAYYLDALDYAQRHFQPQEAIIVIYLGNDVNESSPLLNYTAPQNFIYYDLDSGGQLVLNPASVAARDEFDRGLEFSHQPLYDTLPVILNSYCMTLQLVDSLRDDWKRRYGIRALAVSDPEAAKFGRVGLSLKPYVANDPQGQHAMAVMLAELTLMQQRCETNHVKLHFITVPFFPPQFYATQHGSDWSEKIDGYDFLLPDREVAAFAQEQGIPFLSFADWLKAKKLTAEEIRDLYFTSGSGHFTPRGHELCAEAMFNTFYNQP